MPCLDVRCPCKPSRLQRLYGVEPSRPVCRTCHKDRVDDDTGTCWVCRIAADEGWWASVEAKERFVAFAEQLEANGLSRR